MVQSKHTNRRRYASLVALTIGTAFQFGFLESCDDRFIQATRFFDPCGTFLANCTPGSFEANRAAISDLCVDPACIVPGACPGQGQPLGTTRELCP